MGQIYEYIKIALMNIRHNRGRSILTMLGIIIGISSVIMIISIGNGLHSSVSGELNAIAGGQLYIAVDSSKTDKKISAEDMAALKETVPGVKGVWPSTPSLVAKATSRRATESAVVTAGTADMEFDSADKVIKGHFYTDSDVAAAVPVCVLRESDAKHMFGSTDVIGMELQIDANGIGQTVRIIGIREDSSSQLVNRLTGGEIILSLEVPYTWLGQAYGYDVDSFGAVYVLASPETSSDTAAKSILFLENRLGLRGQNAVNLESFQDIADQFDSILSTITLFVALVAAISLLVGGIGVMNIMLVSVTERTREIGIRKALGARTGSILTQFLAEAAIITSIGGIIGIVLGYLFANIACRIIGFEASISPVIVLMTVLFSSAVGIFFGIYPARKAARLSPIEALRHE